jgi:hypothetical protein
MRLSHVTWAAACAAVLCATPAPAQLAQLQLPRACLHLANESPDEAQRREEALESVRLIDRALQMRPPFTRGPFPTWQELAMSPAVMRLRSIPGRQGEVARTIRWGSDEPLPGWDIHFVAGQNGYAFSLTDSRDACKFTFYANDQGLIVGGLDVQGRGGLIPLETQ